MSLLWDNLKTFFPVVFPSSLTGKPLSPPLRGTDPTSQSLPCAELYYASAVLTPKSPHSMKNVPSGLCLTLPLLSKRFLSTTCQAVAPAKQNLIVSPSFLQPVCLRAQNGLSCTVARYTKGPVLFTGAVFPPPSLHSADRTPAKAKILTPEISKPGQQVLSKERLWMFLSCAACCLLSSTPSLSTTHFFPAMSPRCLCVFLQAHFPSQA